MPTLLASRQIAALYRQLAAVIDPKPELHFTNNLELLFVYLTNERRASDTAQIMHMHRNNVIYRIGKISDMINMDLNESGVRFRLLMAYEIYTPRED